MGRYGRGRGIVWPSHFSSLLKVSMSVPRGQDPFSQSRTGYATQSTQSNAKCPHILRPPGYRGKVAGLLAVALAGRRDSGEQEVAVLQDRSASHGR